MRASAKKRDKARFLHRTSKGWLLQACGSFILRHPPLARFKTSGGQVYSLTNVLQLKKRAGKKCQTEKRTMCLSTILTVTEAVQRQARISWKEQAELRRKFTSLTGRGGWSTASAGLSDSTLSVWGGSVSMGGSVWVGVWLGHVSSLSVVSSVSVWDLVLTGTVWGALEDS